MDYRSDPRMNISRLVAMAKSPKHFRRLELDPPEPTDAMRLGTLIHCLVLEPDEYEKRYCVMPAFENDPGNVTASGKEPSNRKATKYYRDRVKEFQATEKRQVIPEVQYNVAAKAARSFESRTGTGTFTTELPVFGTIEGVECKGLLDMVRPGLIRDLKTTTDVSPRAFWYRFADGFMAERLAFYRELWQQSSGDKRTDCQIVAQETSGDFDTAIYDVPEQLIDSGMRRVREWLRDWKECTARNEWPGVDGGAAIPLFVPDYAMEEELVDWETLNV